MAGVSALLRVRALQPARRRAGFAFSPQPIDIGFDEIARAQFEQLVADPMLVVGIVDPNAGTEVGGQIIFAGAPDQAEVNEVLDELGLAFADEIIGDLINPIEHNTGSGSADLDPAAGAADGGEMTPAAPATETSLPNPAGKTPEPKPSGRKPKS